MTCVGLPRREYFRALSGDDEGDLPRWLPPEGLLPTLVLEGAGMSHPVIAPPSWLGGAAAAAAARVAGSGGISDGAHSKWVANAVRRLKKAGVQPKLAATEFIMRDPQDPYYRTFVHAFTWPVEGLGPDPPARASFCVDGAIGARWEALALPLRYRLRVMAHPELPGSVLAASRLLLEHTPPASPKYAAAAVWVPPALTEAVSGRGRVLTSDEVGAGAEPELMQRDHVVLSVALCDLPWDARSMLDLLRRITSAVDPCVHGHFSCMVNSVGTDRGECLLRISRVMGGEDETEQMTL
jgi:hypothetical protein